MFFKIDHAVKWVKVIPGSLFEQTMMGWSSQCYIPSFVEISRNILEQKIFEVSTIYGHDGHLGHVTYRKQNFYATNQGGST